MLQKYLFDLYGINLSEHELQEMMDWIIDNNIYNLSGELFGTELRKYIIKNYSNRAKPKPFFEVDTSNVRLIQAEITKAALKMIADNQANKKKS